jgi:ABC-type dipeptide/oligopeptide/nickel transport system permease component
MVFLARRIGCYPVTAWVAITLDFFILRLTPGGARSAGCGHA